MSRQSWVLESMFDDKLWALETEAKKAVMNNDIEEAKKVKDKKSHFERLV